jgi:hypothetical protein
VWREYLPQFHIAPNAILRDMKAFLKQRTTDILLGTVTVPSAFVAWREKTLKATVPAGSQGIVVGGQVSTDVRISGNTVSGCLQAIHCGLSDREPRSLGRVAIDRNTAFVVMPPDSVGERHGIFLGSCQSATVRDNYLELVTTTVGRRIEAIRVWGKLGPFLEVVANHVSGFTVGARIKTQPLGEDRPRWRVVDNLFLGATTAVEASPGVVTAPNAP